MPSTARGHRGVGKRAFAARDAERRQVRVRAVVRRLPVLQQPVGRHLQAHGPLRSLVDAGGGLVLAQGCRAYDHVSLSTVLPWSR